MYCHAKYLLYIVKWEEKPVIEQCAEYDLTFVDTQVYTHVKRKWPVGMYITLLTVLMPREWECECGGGRWGARNKEGLGLLSVYVCVSMNIY